MVMFWLSRQARNAVRPCLPATINKQNSRSDIQPRKLSKIFHTRAEKLPCSRRRIDAMPSKIFSTWGIKRGAIMTIAEYLAATALIALIVWGVLGLLMQEG
jgi:hypothetical protein